MSKIRIGVDLGGTKIRAVAIQSEPELTILADTKASTPQGDGYQAVLETICTLVSDVEKSAGTSVTTVGIGTPGVIDRSSNLLKNSNTLCLNGNPIRNDLVRMLGKEVIIENDANCFAVAEDQLGAAKGSSLSFGIIMGTGVGGGLVVNGKPRFGLQGIGGEWGHKSLEPDGAPCYCGKRGCVEMVIGGPALEDYYFSLTGARRTLSEIRELSISGDDAGARTMERLFEKFGHSISVLINILDPDCIVIGGGLSNIPELYTEGVARAKPYIFNSTPVLNVKKNLLGDSAGVFGAAMLT
jgi:predicted NBD/HSP70 family sugar kinase